MLVVSIAVGVILLIASLAYFFRGEAVPRIVYIIAAGLAGVLSPLVWWLRRFTTDSAASFADRFFDLKDTLCSARHFREEKRDGEFIVLQEEATKEKISDLAAESIRYHWPKRLGNAAIVVVLLSVLTAFKQPSPEVLERLEQEAVTLERTAEINEYLEEELEDLAAELEKEVLPEVDPESIRQIPAGLKQTKNQNDALRQYAEVERQLREKAQRLERRKDEALLAAIGKELKEDEANRELGRKLENKEFQKAAEELEKMKPEPVDEKKLSEQRKELARLKSATQRIADAAKAANRKGTAGTSGNSGGGQSGNGGMEGELTSLSDAVSQLDQSLKNAERLSRMGQLSPDQLSECQSCRDAVLSKMDGLCESLCKLNSLCESRRKLLSMCEKLGQCQGFLCQNSGLGQSLSQSLSQSSGGHKAGVGSVESRTSFSDSGNTGQLSQLQGIKGAGPSETMVEEATEGEGTATRRSVSREREYAKQMESFVQREDVPPAVKEGVKKYFEGIHQGEAR